MGKGTAREGGQKRKLSIAPVAGKPEQRKRRGPINPRLKKEDQWLALAVVSAQQAQPVEQGEQRRNHGRDIGESRGIEHAVHRAALVSLHDPKAQQLLFSSPARVVL